MLVAPLVLSTIISVVTVPAKKPTAPDVATANVDLTRTAFSSTPSSSVGVNFVTEILCEDWFPWWDEEFPPFQNTNINDESGIGNRVSITAIVPGGCESVSISPWILIGNGTNGTLTNISAAYSLRAHGKIAGNFPQSGYSAATATIQSVTSTGSKSGQGSINPELTYSDPKAVVITVGTLPKDEAVEFFGSGSLNVIAQ